jgi:hypothetical protein
LPQIVDGSLCLYAGATSISVLRATSSAEKARALWSALGDRLAACKLVPHPVKTKVVYCRDVNRQRGLSGHPFDILGYQFGARKTMWRKGGTRIFTHSLQLAASPKALRRISREVRGCDQVAW